MRFPVHIEALADHSVVLETGGFGKARLLVDGTIHKSKKNVFTVERPGHAPVAIRLKSRFFDPVPNLEVHGNLLQLAPPLHWYQYLWCCAPLILILLGGAIGGAIGGAASFLNVVAFRSVQPGPLRYLATAGISIGAFVAFLLLAIPLALFTAPL